MTDLRQRLRAAIGEHDEDEGLEHWHHASGGRRAPTERAGVFVDRQQVLDAIDAVLVTPAGPEERGEGRDFGVEMELGEALNALLSEAATFGIGLDARNRRDLERILAAASKPLDARLLAIALERAEDNYAGYGWPDSETHAATVIAEYEAMLTAPTADEVRGILSQCAACGHFRSSHSSGGMCDGGGTECYCVRFPDAPDFAGDSR